MVFRHLSLGDTKHHIGKEQTLFQECVNLTDGCFIQSLSVVMDVVTGCCNDEACAKAVFQDNKNTPFL